MENSVSVSSLGHGEELWHTAWSDPRVAVGCSYQTFSEGGNEDGRQAVSIDRRSGKGRIWNGTQAQLFCRSYMFLKLKIWLNYKNNIRKKWQKWAEAMGNISWYPADPAGSLVCHPHVGRYSEDSAAFFACLEWSLGILTWKPYSGSRIYKPLQCLVAENFCM